MSSCAKDLAVVPCLFPQRRHLCGPVTSRRILRSFLVYLALFASGLIIAELAEASSWRAFGLGLMLPGGGFLADADAQSWHGAAHLAIAAMVLAAFVAALFFWFATGNAVLPPLIWLSSAIAAARMPDGVVRHEIVLAVTLAIITVLIVAVAVLGRGRFRRHRFGSGRNGRRRDRGPLSCSA